MCAERVVYKMFCLIDRIPLLCHVSASLHQTSLSLNAIPCSKNCMPSPGQIYTWTTGAQAHQTRGTSHTVSWKSPSAQHVRKVREVVDNLADGVFRFGGLETSHLAFVFGLWQR